MINYQTSRIIEMEVTNQEQTVTEAVEAQVEPGLKHFSYPSIINANTNKHVDNFRVHIDKVRLGNPGYNPQCIIEEKVDGSNFVLVTDGVDCEVGKRSCFIDTDNPKDTFYNYEHIHHRGKPRGLDAMRLDAINLRNRLVEADPSLRVHTMYMYGEIIPTQTRIKYVGDVKKPGVHADNVYAIFFEIRFIDELLVRNGNMSDVMQHKVLHKNVWESHAKDHGFLVVPTWKTGTLDECLEFDVENTDSCIPEIICRYHNAEDESYKSIHLPIEGVVIKHYHGANHNYKPPFVVKKKAEAFVEMERGKNKPDRKGKHGGSRFTPKASDVKNDKVHDALWEMLCINRLDNVVSKIGHPEEIEPNPHRLANTVVLDAITEMKADESSILHTISGKQLAKVKDRLVSEYTPEVKKRMGW